MTAQLVPLNVFRGTDNNGNPLVSGQLFTYIAGTTTPQATYTDSTQSQPNTNPVILNARGEAAVWLDPTKVYKLLLQDALGNTIPGWPVDQIPGGMVPVSQLSTYVTQSFIGQQLYPQTASEIAANVTPTNYFYPPFYLPRYGADPTGVVASDAAFNSAVSVCGSLGGTIRAPAGLYTFASANTALNLKNGIIIQGDGPPSSGTQPGTRFQFTGTSGPWFSFNGSQGVWWRGIQFIHTNAGFTGTYFQSNKSGVVVPSMCGFSDCTAGNGVSNTNHININTAINFTVERCSFSNFASSGSIVGAQAGGFANNVAIRDCQFFNGAGAPIQNGGPHQAWVIEHNDFEGLSLATNTPAGAILSTASTGTWSGLMFAGNWCGDAGTAVGAWIDAYLSGGSIQGNYFSGNTTGTSGVNLRGSNGIAFGGNMFTGLLNGINFATATCGNVSVRGNVANSVTNPWANLSNITLGTLDWAANFGFGVPSGHGAPTNTNGYRVYPDSTGGSAEGQIEQWGTKTVATATGTLTFTTEGVLAFPNACSNVVATLQSGGTSIDMQSLTATTVAWSIAGFSNPAVFMWRAIGN